jgi:hypothetical protein
MVCGEKSGSGRYGFCKIIMEGATGIVLGHWGSVNPVRKVDGKDNFTPASARPRFPEINLNFSHPQTQSPLIFACRKYFIPTQATTTQTQAITAVKIISAG